MVVLVTYYHLVIAALAQLDTTEITVNYLGVHLIRVNMGVNVLLHQPDIYVTVLRVTMAIRVK